MKKIDDQWIKKDGTPAVKMGRPNAGVDRDNTIRIPINTRDKKDLKKIGIAVGRSTSDLLNLIILEYIDANKDKIINI